MSDKSKEESLIDAHMGHLNNRLDRFDSLFDKIFDNQAEMSKILERNTTTVEEHHKRSTYIESVVESLKKALEALSNKFSVMEEDVESLKDDVNPIKNHVNEVSSVMHFFKWLPKIFKGIILLLTFVTTIYGVVSIFKDVNTNDTQVIEKSK